MYAYVKGKLWFSVIKEMCVGKDMCLLLHVPPSFSL